MLTMEQRDDLFLAIARAFGDSDLSLARVELRRRILDNVEAVVSRMIDETRGN